MDPPAPTGCAGGQMRHPPAAGRSASPRTGEYCFPVGELILVLCGVVVKTAFRLWTGDGALADNLTADLTDLVRERVGSVLDQRKVRRHFEQTEELIARQLLSTLDHEYRDLDSGERDAAIIAVTTTFQRAQLTDQRLFSSDLDRLYLYRYVRRAAGNATAGLSEGGIELYERVLEQCCGYVIEIADKLPGFQAGAFGELLRRDRQILDRLDEVLQHFPAASRDQQQASVDRAYRQRIVQVFDRLELFGLDFAAQWYSLSIAYVNLSVTGGDGPQAPERLADILAARAAERGGRPDDGESGRDSADAFGVWLNFCARLIISGRAGGGKTTVLQWLAVRAATGTFGLGSEELNGCTPFLVKLREYAGAALPAPEEFLGKVAPMLAPEASGWPRERMRAGRALFLVDGADELPEEQRPAVAAWLRELTELFPRVRYVLTTRPGALDVPVRPRGSVLDALQETGFRHATLEPMDPPLVQRFVAQWHAAVRAGLTDQAAREQLAAGEAKLAATLGHDRFLRDLADTPLLAALICALHQHLRGQLPSRRGEIFETALAMFRQRDLDRGIPGDLDLDLAATSHLLGDLALALVRNGATEVGEADAQRALATSAATLPDVPPDGEQLYRHLLLRSGLLREPVAGRVDFVHRTFQEYLAAKALMSTNHVGEIVRNAGDDQWREVVILAAGQGNTAQATALLRGLLRRGRDRQRRQMLAVACMQEVKSADADVLHEVYSVVAELLPPRTVAETEALSSIGDRLLPLLESHPPETREERVATIRAATLVGGREALPVIARLARDQGTYVTTELTRAWPYFDSREFARDVLAPSGVTDLNVDTADQLSALRFVPRLRTLAVYYDSASFHDSPGRTRQVLEVLDELPDIRELTLVSLPAETLTGVIGRWPLHKLSIVAHQLRDLSALSLLVRLETLVLSCAGPAELDVLTDLPRLRALTLFGTENFTRTVDWSVLAGDRVSVSRVSTRTPVTQESLAVVAQLPHLEFLYLRKAGKVDLSPLAHRELQIILSDTTPTGITAGFRPSGRHDRSTSTLDSLARGVLRR